MSDETTAQTNDQLREAAYLRLFVPLYEAGTSIYPKQVFKHAWDAATETADRRLANATPAVSTPAEPVNASLVAELTFLPTYVNGTLRGEPLPLADFTRDRIGRALTDAASAITELTAAAEAAKTLHLNPPAGWVMFGTHVDYDGDVEFWGVEPEDGSPIWERATDAVADATQTAFEEAAVIIESFIRADVPTSSFAHLLNSRFTEAARAIRDRAAKLLRTV